jgi:hypothetical protein
MNALGFHQSATLAATISNLPLETGRRKEISIVYEFLSLMEQRMRCQSLRTPFIEKD